MKEITPAIIADNYETNTWLINRLTEGLSHEDSLLQLPFPTNCLNWVLGHIVRGRNLTIGLLGGEPPMPAELSTRYQTGSDPILSAEGAVDFQELLGYLNEAQAHIAGALAALPPEALLADGETDRGVKPVGEHIAGLHWHETYHIGQLEILREHALDTRTESLT